MSLLVPVRGHFPYVLGLAAEPFDPGPAHAVYFGTYEFVKESAGGNKDDNHHPFAAGIWRLRHRPSRGISC